MALSVTTLQSLLTMVQMYVFIFGLCGIWLQSIGKRKRELSFINTKMRENQKHPTHHVIVADPKYMSLCVLVSVCVGLLYYNYFESNVFTKTRIQKHGKYMWYETSMRSRRRGMPREREQASESLKEGDRA